jgi:YD repeat-containing protein
MTSFNTIDGQILDQIDALGNVTEYMHDALGSVTGTTDGSSNVQNTYRWSPYGSLLSKIGTQIDPQFLWVGGLGYRYTGREHADSYVRARHYGQAQSGWSSIDRHWKIFGQYAYCKGQGVSIADPSGEALPGATRIGAGVDYVPDSCGGCTAQWRFEIVGGASVGFSGWLIQQVTNTYATYACGNPTYQMPGGCIVPGSTNAGPSQTYYEAWQINKGIVMIPNITTCSDPPDWINPNMGVDDVWGLVASSSCSTGSATRTGMLVVDTVLPQSFGVHPTSCAGCLPMSSTPLTGYYPWEQAASQRNWWSCCGHTATPNLKCICPCDSAGCTLNQCKVTP